MSSVSDVEENIALLKEASTVPAALWREAQERGLLDRRVPIT